ESHDSDFTWSEFYRRTNDELVAGWGNPVNRAPYPSHKTVGATPAAALTDADRALLAQVNSGFEKVGELLGTHRQRAAINEAMHLVAETNKYLSDTAPWKLKEDRDRQGAVLFTAAQAISDLNTMLSPFLPHSSQAVHETFGGSGLIAPQPRIDEVTDLDDPTFEYPIITGDYASTKGTWARRDLTPGTTVGKPSPVFTKLDESIVEAELERLRAQGEG